MSIQSKRWLFVLVLSVLTSCGGKKEAGETPSVSDPAPQSPALSSCNVGSIGAGETFVCEAPGFEEGCTCFVCGTPTRCDLLKEDPEVLGEVALDVGEMTGSKALITAPVITCQGDVSFVCGAGEETTIAQEFSVISPAGPTKAGCVGTGCEDKEDSNLGCKTDEDCDWEGEQCENGYCVSPHYDPPPPVLTGCKDNIDCGDGKTCTSYGTCIVPPVSPVLTASVTGKLDPNRLGVVQVAWNIGKGAHEIVEAYLYGVFNRASGDGTTCGLSGTRYLVTNPDGTDIRKDSPNYGQDKYGPYLGIEPNKGVECADDSICHELKKFNLGLPYSWVHGPLCKIDLMTQLQKGKLGQVIYTKMRSPVAGYALYVRDKSGKVVFKDPENSKENPKLEAPVPVVASNVTVRQDRPLIHVSVSYTHLVRAPWIQGCVPPPDASPVSPPNAAGSGSLEADCLLNPSVSGKGQMLTIYASGVGSLEDDDAGIYTVRFDRPVPRIQKGAMTCDTSGPLNAQTAADCFGTLDIHWGVDRDCKIQKNFETEVPCSAPVVHWVKSIELWGHSLAKAAANPQAPYDRLELHEVKLPPDTSGVLKASRNHDKTSWAIRVNDYNGDRIESDGGRNDLTYGYMPFFDVTDPSFVPEFLYNSVEGDSCSHHLNGGRLVYSFNWKGRHLRRVDYSCLYSFCSPGGPLVCNPNPTQPSTFTPPPSTSDDLINQYETVVTTVRAQNWIGDLDATWRSAYMTCTLTGYSYDGLQTITKTLRLNDYRCSK